MKQILKSLTVLLLIVVLSCTQGSISPYASNITYWSLQVAQTGVAITEQTKLLVEATKAHKVDSVLIYTANLSTLAIQELQYKDSLLYYINLSKDSISTK